MTSPILAQQTMQERIAIFQKMGSQIEGGDPNMQWKILAAVVLVVAAALLTWLIYVLQRRREATDRSPQPMRLFLRTMRELGLPGPDLWQLYRLAKRLGLKHPTALLISPRFFDQAATDDCCDKGGKVLARSRHQRLMAIRTILFGADISAA